MVKHPIIDDVGVAWFCMVYDHCLKHSGRTHNHKLG